MDPVETWDRQGQARMLVYVVAAFVFVVATAMGAVLLDRALRNVEPVACQEDEACWDCSTMGNQVCGPVQRVVTR